MWAGRAWVTGTRRQSDDAQSDAALWGLTLEEAPEPEGLWPEHRPAFVAFTVVATQWRILCAPDGRMIYTGLDYAGVDAGLRRAGIETTPTLWADLRMIEAGALAALQEVSP